MSLSFNAYIDESGCVGFKFRDPPEQKASSDWFIVSAVLVSAENDKAIVQLANGIRNVLGFGRDHLLHFSKLSHEQRVAAAMMIASSRIRTISVVLNKREIKNKAVFAASHDRLYFYALRFLLERVSWLARDEAKRRGLASPLVRVRIEHRRHTSYDDLSDYLSILKTKTGKSDWERYVADQVRIHWPAISDRHVTAHQKAQFSGLQIADLVASGIRWAIEKNRFEQTEHRYAKVIIPTMYEVNGKRDAYGVKFFPEPPSIGSPGRHWYEKYISG